jgi:general secretion pathway protein A
MEYYHILNLKKEPFSNSPEPDFLFQSPQHTTCLQMLELAVRLRRGLNVVIGDVGTGKTTLCRKLIQNFSFTTADSPEIETHLLLDPALSSTHEFLQTVAILLGIKDFDSQENEWHLKERIKNYLFSKGVDEEKIIVLIIDEGQKIPKACLEVLREFLNYETNNLKLLQIIIFAQKEFRATLNKHYNLSDRVNFLYYLKPLNFRQMRAMINYRINIARDSEIAQSLFSFWSLALIYMATQGYPRKVVSLCHQVILMLIIRGKKKAGLILVKNSITEMAKPLFLKAKWAVVSILIIFVLGFTAITFFTQHLVIDTSGQKTVSAIGSNSPAYSSNDNLLIVQNIDKKMPGNMGTIKVSEGSTLWQILKNVYGNANPEIVYAVLKANPQIKDTDVILAGTIITFPSIPSGYVSLKKGDLIIQIEVGKNMGIVYNSFLENIYEQNVPPLVFFPFWNKREEGINFAVIIDKCFNNIRDVEDEIGKLPPEYAAKTIILSEWDENTVFFNRKIIPRLGDIHPEAK